MRSKQTSIKIPKRDNKYKQCQICGKEITGDCHVINTKRKTTLYIHFDCVRNANK